MLYAETVDTGATVSLLRAFGPPDILELADFAGTGSAVIGADNFWTIAHAVSLELDASAAVADRLARLTWRALEAAPFAQALAPFALQANDTGQVTFADGVQQAGATGSPTILAPMPRLVLLPGWTLTLDVLDGDAGDAITGARCYLQRYQLVPTYEPTVA